MLISFAVWRYIYLHTTWEEDDCMFGGKGERLHTQWKAQGSQRRGNLQPSHYPRVW